MNSSTLVQTSDAIAGTVVDVTTAGTSSITLNNATNGDLDTMAGSIVLSNASSTGIGVGNYTFVMGTANTAAGTGAAGTYVTAAATMASLATKIAAVETASTDPAGINLTASDTTGTLTLTSKTALAAGNLTLSADTLTDTANQIVGTNATTTATFAVGGQAAASSASNGISGSIVLADTAHTDTFIVGSGTNAGTVFYTGNTEADETMAGLAAAITAAHGVNSDFTVTSDGAAGLILGDSGATNITTSTSTLINQTNSMTGVIDAKLPSAAVASTGAGVDTSATAIDSSQLTATGDTITGTVVISSSTANTATQGSVTDTFVMGAGTASAVSAAGTNANTFSITGTTLNDLINEINLSGTALAVTGGGAQADHNMEVTATLNAAGSGLTLTDTTSGANLGTSITVTSSALSDASTLSFTTPAGGDDVENSTGVIALTDGGALALSGAGTGQTLSGSVVVTNGTGLSAVSDTFVMGQSSATSTYAVGGGTFNITGSTVAALATAINAEGIDAAHSGEADLNLTASVDAQTGGVFVQSSYPGVSGLTANTTGLTMTLTENASQGTNGAAGATTAPAEAQFSNGGINSQGDPIAGSVVLANVHSGSTYGLGGGAVTFVVGAGTDSNTTYYTGGTAADETMGGLANAINLANSNLTLALSATASATGLTVVSTDNTSVINFGGGTNTLVDQYGALQGTQVTGGAAQGATHATAAVGTSGQIGASDALSGSITLDNGGTTQTFIIGSTYNNLTPNTITTGGTNIQDLATAINDDLGLGVGATVVNGVLQLQANSTATSITVGTGTADTLIDTVTSTAVTTNTGAPGGLSSASLKLAGGLTTANSNDSVSGSITLTGSGGTKTFVVGGTTSGSVVGVGNTSSGETLGNLAAEITAAGIGITAGVGTAGLTLTGSTDNPTAITTSGLNTLKDTTTTAALSYTAASPYNVGISNSTLGSGQSLYDSSTGQAANGTMVDFVTNDSGGGGIATISYSDSAGQSLNSTDLSNQTDAQAALLDLNHAITDVAAQDGYIGAQINTLNAVSQVLATQQENVVSAQNAVQATDYASATSNMSKYEILSQTGISALAQANSLQQEVTKLLQ
jgi:flagellin